jgi:O-antigen/teichoic acid export membrane protein
MSLTQKIAHNTAIQFAGKIIGTVLALVTVGLMLRYLGREGFGQFSTAVNFLSVFAIMIDLGLYLIVTREISKKGADENKLVSNTFTFRLVIGLVVLSIAPIVGLFMPYAEITQWAIAVNASAFLFMSLNQILTGVFQKYLRMDKVAIAEILGRIFWVVAVYGVIQFDLGLLWVVGANTVAALLNFIVLYLYSKRYVKIRLAFDFSMWKKIWKSAAPLAVNVILNLVYFKAGIIVLTLIDTEQAVGTLGAAQKILENLITFSAIFAGLLFPLFSKYVKSDALQFKNVFQKGFDALSIIVLPLVVGSIFLARDIVVLFGGGDFASSAPVLQILMIAVGAIFFGNLFGNIVVAADLQKKLVPVYIVNAALALGLSFLLIPSISYFGAAIATLVTEVVIVCAAGFLVYKKLHVFPKMHTLLKASVAAAGMFGVLYFLPETLHVLIKIAIGATLYFILLYVFKGISKELIVEILMLRRAGKRSV